MNGSPISGDDVALFIDWENFKISLAGGNRTPNVSALKEEVSNHGRVVVAKAYADWVTRSPELKGASQFIIDPPALYASGIEPVYVPTRLPLGTPSAMNSRTTRVKNSVDVKMTADCIECAHSYPNIGTYVLVSGDSDFIHVINSLRSIGKRVIIIGVSWSTSRRLADQVDGLILYDMDVDPEIQPEPEPAPVPGSRTSRPGNDNRQQVADVMRLIEDIVRSERQAGRTPLLTSLKQRIMRRVPGFDEKKLGFSGFKKLMLRTAEEGNIKLVTVGLVDWVIMADEPIPEEALPESRSDRGSVETVAADEEVVLDSDDRSGPADTGTGSTADSAGVGVATSIADPAAQPSADGEAQAAQQSPSLEMAAETESDSATSETPNETEASSDAAETDATEDAAPQPLSPGLASVLEETLAGLELPRGPGDGQDGRRITDLVIMADMLEHQEGVTHVAFNFLLAEICGALQQGLDADHPEITGRWGGRTYSRTYVTRLLRELGEKDIFTRGWHQERDEESGRSRRFRTFNLNRASALVREALVSQWGPDTDAMAHEPASPADAASEEPPAPEALDESDLSTTGVVVETQAEAETPVEEASTPPPARPSRRRGRQRPAAEEEPQSPEAAASQSVAGEAETAESVVADEAAPARPARTPRRRGRQSQPAEETAQAADEVVSEPTAAEAQASEAAPARPARTPRRRGRQSHPAEETPQASDEVVSQPPAAEAQADESAPSRPARTPRRRGRQSQPAEVNSEAPAGAPEPATSSVAENPVPDAEPAPAALD